MNPLRRFLFPLAAVVSWIAAIVMWVFSSGYAPFFVAFFFLYGIFLLIWYGIRIRTLGRRMFNKMPDFDYVYEYEYCDSGYKVSSEKIKNEINWSYYSKALLGNDMIMLYPNRVRFNFFPRRVFRDSEFEQLKIWVRQNVPNHKEIK